MRITDLLSDERAVSSTLGIVLLVAVTVILAAIFGAFAFGLLGNEAAPNTEFNYDFNGAGNEVEVTHDGGDRVDGSKLAFGEGWGVGSGSFDCQIVQAPRDSGDVVINSSAGGRCQHEAGSGTDLSLIWESDNGESFIIDERSRSA